MRGKVYTYNPINPEKVQFVIKRNESLAKYFAKITDKEYKGDIQLKNRINDEDVIFAHSSITSLEAQKLGVTSQKQIFGVIANDVYTKKTIFHLPTSNNSKIPKDFPLDFANYIYENDLSLPGYSCFTLEEVCMAINMLMDKNIVPRIKSSLGSGGVEQFKVRDVESAIDFCKKLDVKVLEKYGVVVEANLINSRNKDSFVETYSGGWISINNSTHSYIGKQDFKDRVNFDKYAGTTLNMVRGDIQELVKILPGNERYKQVYNSLSKVKEGLKYLPSFYGTRVNFDFLYGQIEYLDCSHEQEDARIFVAEQSFRAGGATPAELIAKFHLDQNPNIDSVTTTSKVNFGVEDSEQFGKNSQIFLKLTDDPVYGEVQIWAYVND